MSDDTLKEAPTSEPVQVEGGSDLEFGVTNKNGRVVLRFNKLINWFDLDPETAIAYAEAIINNAVACKEKALKAQGLVRQSTPALVLPRSKMQ